MTTTTDSQVDPLDRYLNPVHHAAWAERIRAAFPDPQERESVLTGPVRALGNTTLARAIEQGRVPEVELFLAARGA
jgi:hypothetical protein